MKASHVFAALRSARGGPVAEGAVGAGTGMMTYEFKGGIGTSSRRLARAKGGHTVGEAIADLRPGKSQEGSITVVVATDAPLDARQLSRLARRAMLGVCRTGAVAAHGSGDVAVAFSTANRVPHYPKRATYRVELLSDFHIDPLFEAAADAAEESVINAMLAARTVVGRDGNTAHALPQDRLRRLLGR